MVEFDVTMSTKDMYDYNIYHNYRNANGISGIIIGIICLCLCVAGIMNDANISYILMMGFIGLFFTIITPFRIYLKSAQQVKLTPSFRQPLHYTINDREITISQASSKASFPLTEVRKAVDTGKSIVVYATRTRAYVFPKTALGNQEEQLKAILRSSLDAGKYRIK